MYQYDSALKAWYLVFTKPRMENVAQSNLERQSYHTYLPKVLLNKRVRGRYSLKSEVMFPRYLFIHLDTVTDNWMPIRSTLGVSHMVRFGGIPAQVPEALLQQLHSREDMQGNTVLPVRELTPGDPVEILEGPMAGYIGVFEHHASCERVQILLKIVGEHTRVSLDRHSIQLAM